MSLLKIAQNIFLCALLVSTPLMSLTPQATAAIISQGPTQQIPMTQSTTKISQTSSAQQVPATLALNPTTLRKQLLETNLSLTQTLNSVKDAKDQVSVARANLLPSLNLGSLLSSGTSFILSSVSFLLPFLAPSNWFNYKAQKANFEAEKISYLIMELNLYSSALALYLTVTNDSEVQQAYQQEAKDLDQYVEIRNGEIKMGTSSDETILPLEAQAHTAELSASQLAQLVQQEIASMRQLLGLPLSTQITLQNADMPASPWESKTIQDTVDQANSVAPEHQQIQYLVKAAKSKKWSTVFSFINSSTFGGSNYGGNGLVNVGLGSSASLGFGLFPSIKLSSRNIEEVKLLDTQLVQSNTQLIESAMKSLIEGRSQYEFAASAEKEYQQIYDIRAKEYELGALPIADLIYARTQIADATVARLRAELNLNLQRVTIDRALVTDPFSQIKGCRITDPSQQKKKMSLDQLCKQTGT